MADSNREVVEYFDRLRRRLIQNGKKKNGHKRRNHKRTGRPR